MAVDPPRESVDGQGRRWATVMPVLILVGFLAAVVVLNTAFGGGGSPQVPAADDVASPARAENAAAAAPTTSSDQCVAEFQRAAAIDDMHDEVTDLDNAMALCGSIDAWVNANVVTGAIEGDPVEFLLNRCKYGPENRRGHACLEVTGLYPSGLYDHPYAAP